MQFNQKEWNGLEATSQIENSLFGTTISKQKWKLLNVTFPKVLHQGHCFFLFS